MTSDHPKLSLVCPAYEEAEVLPLFHVELAAALEPLARDFGIEIIYIDDGSKDRTLQVLQELAAHDPRVVYLSLSRNFGKEAAILAGLEHARGDYVITMDSDLQHPPALIPDLVAKAREGFDVVMTHRHEFKRMSVGQKIATKFFYWMLGRLSDTEIPPASADFLLLSRRALQNVLQLRERHRFFKGLVHWLGLPCATVAFTPSPRKAGQTKFNFQRLARLAADSIVSFSRSPLRLSLYLGFFITLLGLGLGGVFLGGWMLGHDIITPVLGWIIVGGLMLDGIILCSLGVVGEYLGRVFEQVKERPVYVLKASSLDQQAAIAPLPKKDAA